MRWEQEIGLGKLLFRMNSIRKVIAILSTMIYREINSISCRELWITVFSASVAKAFFNMHIVFITDIL